mmetsp:Transcript_1717/g.2367  ORF Transcript_1717/g.2367 Transcript_1717/m.2367 type:complete len:866 (-) Transcript_1717:571-3168(-)
MDLTATLLGAASADLNVRTQAEQALKEWETRDLPGFVTAISQEIGTEGNHPTARQLAGLYMKNLLVAKDDQLQITKTEAWKNLQAAVRAGVKQQLLLGMRSTEVTVRSTAAQAASEVAAVELPYNEWPEFLTTLLEYVASDQHPEGAKIASLQCLGFTCERVMEFEDAPEISPETTDQMLTTIVDGIRATRPDNIRYAAAKALFNSLAFTQKNMERKEERDTIMQTVCEATQAQDARVRGAAFECIACIASEYYDKLGDYIQTIFELTFNTIKNDEEDVAKGAMEFWSTLAEVEFELIDIEAEAKETGQPVERPCVRYVAAALEHLVPLLTETLTRQDEDADPDDDVFNISMAASTCLINVSATVEDLLIPVMTPFIQTNIQNENWRLREAATMAFVALLEGSGPDTIGPYIQQIIPLLLQALNDQNVLVKDTTAYCIGKICDLHVRSIPNEMFPTIVHGLMGKFMTETPRVSQQACFAIHNLAAAFATDDSAETTGTNAMSQFMAPLLQTLLQAADREDADEANLRQTAYSSVLVLIQYSAPDCQHILLQLLPATIDRLQKSFYMPVLTNDDRDKKERLQGLLCAQIQVLCQKLTKEHVTGYADTIMTNLLQVLQVKSAACHEEAFATVGSMADILEGDFEKYMAALQPFLLMGIRNFEAYRVCTCAVGVVGDICRAIENKIQPFCNDIMQALVEALKDTKLHRSVKPPVLCCFGDIALAVCAAFEPFLQFSLMLLMQASNTRAPDDDEDLIEYVNTLREAILEAYTGIVQGMKDGSRIDLLLPHITSPLQLLAQVATDPNRDVHVLGKAVGLLGDIASTMKQHPPVAEQLNQAYVAQLLSEAQQSGDETLMETAQWAASVVQA